MRYGILYCCTVVYPPAIYDAVLLLSSIMAVTTVEIVDAFRLFSMTGLSPRQWPTRGVRGRGDSAACRALFPSQYGGMCSQLYSK